MSHDLPNELLIEILWNTTPTSLLASRLVCKRFKVIVDTSSRLQLCIELYRDDLHLAPFHISGFQKIQQHDQYQLDSDGRNIKVHDILASQLQHRQRWESFNPRMVGRITSGFNDWFYYEFNNGCLAYSEENDTIIFQDPRNNASDDYPAKTLKLPFPTADFTFDLSQDLLVVLNAAYAQLPIHILSASTGTAHPRASRPIINHAGIVGSFFNEPDTGRLEERGIFDNLSGKLVIKNSSVCVAYDANALCPRRVMVFDWTTSNIIFDKLLINDEGGAILLSPTVLAVLDSQVRFPTPYIDLYDLAERAEERNNPSVVLYLPGFVSTETKQSDSARFISPSYSTGPDAGNDHQISRDMDVIPILRSVYFYPEGSHFKHLLLISRRRLLELVSRPSHSEHSIYENTEPVPNESAQETLPPKGPTVLAYEDWGMRGTRWIDATNIAIASCYGSRMVCVADPHQFGLPRTHPPEPNCSSALDDACSIATTKSICVLEFNKRLWDADTSNTDIVHDYDLPGGVLAELDAQVERSMPFRVRFFNPPVLESLEEVIIHQKHIMLIRENDTGVYTV